MGQVLKELPSLRLLSMCILDSAVFVEVMHTLGGETDEEDVHHFPSPGLEALYLNLTWEGEERTEPMPVLGFVTNLVDARVASASTGILNLPGNGAIGSSPLAKALCLCIRIADCTIPQQIAHDDLILDHLRNQSSTNFVDVDVSCDESENSETVSDEVYCRLSKLTAGRAWRVSTPSIVDTGKSVEALGFEIIEPRSHRTSMT